MDGNERDPITTAILSMTDRLGLVQRAGYQLAALTKALHEPIKRLRTAESADEEVVVSVLLDRLAKLAEIVQDLGENEEEPTQDELADALRVALDRE